jgi:hypothetical protein
MIDADADLGLDTEARFKHLIFATEPLKVRNSHK